MQTKKLIQMVFLLSIVLFSISCSTYNVQSTTQASYVGFTKEMDEPSSRGQLVRISPEQSNVHFRYCLSQDNENIVYSGTQSGGSDNIVQLWKIPSNGNGSPIKLTSGGASHKTSPSFTNDGSFIVYSSNGQLWKIRSDGAGGKMKIPGSGMNQDFSPHVSKNNKVAFCSYQGSRSSNGSVKRSRYLIWASNLDGGELTQLREGKFPYWSPDGSKIVFEHKNEIWLINADGTNLMQLTNTPKISEGLPTFSPDGLHIAYTSNEDSNGKPMTDYNIWTMNSDGAEKKQITELDSWDSWPIWSSDGIYFVSARAQQKSERNQRIWKLKTK